jgi:hypothetical protein
LILTENAGFSPAFIYEAEGFVLKRFNDFKALKALPTISAKNIDFPLCNIVYYHNENQEENDAIFMENEYYEEV